METRRFASGRHLAAASMLLVGMLCGPSAFADGGFYVGGSLGKAAFDIEEFGSDATAWKGFGGFLFDLPVIDLAVELSYVDFGSQSDSFMGESADLDVTGISAFGVAGIDFGPMTAFAKYGVVDWDAKINLSGISGSDSGNDPAYGVGVSFHLSSVEIRGEYEKFDVQDTDDVNMISVGVVWRF